MNPPSEDFASSRSALPLRLLAIRCKLGEESAWRELVSIWQPKLWRFALGMLGRRTDAEEALQAIWLQVVRSFGRLREPDRLTEWMYGVARRVVLDRLRQRYGTERKTEPMDVNLAADGLDPELALELREDVLHALAALAPRDREAVVLHYLESRSLEDIAALCAAPIGTIKSRLHRSRRLLRRLLTDQKEIS